MSASINPVFAPPCDKAKARFAATVLLPTPPFPLTTAIIFFTLVNIAAPSVLLVVVLEVNFTFTTTSLFTCFIELTQAFFIISFKGQAGGCVATLLGQREIEERV